MMKHLLFLHIQHATQPCAICLLKWL